MKKHIDHPAEGGRPAYQHRDYLLRQVDHYALKKYEIALSWLRDCPCSLVLNVGCGSGELNILLARQGYKVDAFDPSEEAVLLARSRARESGIAGVSIWRDDLLNLRTSTLYDAVLCLDVIEHIKDDRLAVERLADVLRADGRLLISVPALQALFGYHDEQLGHYRRYSKAQLENLLSGRFVVENASYFGFFLIPLVVVYSKLLRKAYPVERSGGAVPRFILNLEARLRLPAGTSLLIKARKKR